MGCWGAAGGLLVGCWWAAGGLLVGCWRVVAAECDFKVVAGAVRSASSSLTRFGASDEQGFSGWKFGSDPEYRHIGK